MKRIFFTQTPDIKFNYSKKRKLQQFVQSLFQYEKKKLEFLQYVFCSDEFLLNLNLTYLNHNTYTDIITFDLSEKGKPINGEVYISIERVKENSKENHQKFSEELERVVFHGALHLCGYRDKKTTDKQAMTKKENYYLQKFNVIRGTLKK